MGKTTPLVIKGVRIDPSVLRRERVDRCVIEECRAACCSGGVWLDLELKGQILDQAGVIKSFLPPERHDETRWFGSEKNDRDFPSGRCVESAIVQRPDNPDDTCCVFLRPDLRCALQATSEAVHLGWPGLKPFYCALYPLYVEDNRLMVDDDTPAGFRCGWCRRPAKSARRMLETYRDEAELVLGEDGYRELLETPDASHQPTPSRRRTLRIVILYDADADAESHPRGTIPPSVDIGVVATDVETSLKQLGHAPTRVAAVHPIEATIARIRSYAPDLVFNLCEAFDGAAHQEGNVAGLLELLDIPFTGSPAASLHLALHKARLKEILRAHDILTPNWFVAQDPFFPWKRQIAFPAIVKPEAEDASLGIGGASVVRTVPDVRARVGHIVREFEQPALVEEFISGREVNVAMVGGEVVEISEIDFSGLRPGVPHIVTYQGKWNAGSSEYAGTTPVCPAKLPKRLRRKLESLAVKTWEVVGARDYARVDMRIDEQDRVHVLEFNPNPDLSTDAGLVRSALAIGWSYRRLVDEIIRLAERRVAADAAAPTLDGTTVG